VTGVARDADVAGEDSGAEQQRGPQQVELLLDTERPVVLQGRHRPLRVEVVGGLEGEPVIADIEGTRHGVLGDGGRLERAQYGNGHGDRDHNDQHSRRQETAGPAGVEATEREPPSSGDLVPEELGDQVARDHEEDVNADVASGNGQASVIGDNGEDRYGP
jgi:hypothetical protein